VLHRDVCTGQKLETKGRRSVSAPDRGRSAIDHHSAVWLGRG
jgi:hypothetical protein